MSETALAEQQISSKRKRPAQDLLSGRPFKRDTSDSFMMDPLGPTQSSGGASVGVNVSDFDALQQATADHSEISHPSIASSTAAAALGYPLGRLQQATNGGFGDQGGVPIPTPGTGNSGLFVPEEAQPNGTSDVAGIINQTSRPTINPPHQHLAQPTYPKAAVGSDEWHTQRKQNHKEVERRRRETINEGINELAKIVPNCEKNKGHILANAVEYITQLEDAKKEDMEKHTLEKLLTEQAITELTNANSKSKTECEHWYLECQRWQKEAENWKALAMSAGLSLPPTASEQEPQI